MLVTNKEPEKEARLGEVLAEVSLADIGRMLKGGGASVGCLAVYLMVVLVLISAADATGYGSDQWGIPNWVLWLLIVWLCVYAATSEKSYHESKMSWYFPKLNWLTSLILAAYFVGFGYLLSWVNGMDAGFGRAITFFFVYLCYTSPFLLFMSAIRLGHEKLMEKRRAAALDFQEPSKSVEW